MRSEVCTCKIACAFAAGPGIIALVVKGENYSVHAWNRHCNFNDGTSADKSAPLSQLGAHPHSLDCREQGSLYTRRKVVMMTPFEFEMWEESSQPYKDNPCRYLGGNIYLLKIR